MDNPAEDPACGQEVARSARGAVPFASAAAVVLFTPAVSSARRCHGDTIDRMAMTLRLSDSEAEALRKRAAREARSMHDVARQAVREYIENHSRAELLDRVLDEELPRYAEALERLGE